MKKNSNYDIKFLPAKKLTTNRSYTLAINDYGELFSWGNNKDCRVGHEIENKEFIIQIPKKHTFFNNNYLKLLEVSCGDNHILALGTSKNDVLQKSGDVCSWGLTMHGRLGYIEESVKAQGEDSMNYVITPKRLTLPDKVVRVACGSDFSACITTRGELYTWGNNKLGYLGVETVKIEDEQSYVTTPTLVKSLMSKVVIQVACGSKHMMCLTSDRLVYSWGSGSNGVLGHDNNDGLNKPEMIKDLKQHEIIFIAAGEFSSAAINNYGHLFMWGRGKYGILGQGSEENQAKPKRIQDTLLANEKVFFVSCGFYHTLCCSMGDKSFAWGYSEDGRLGCVDKIECDSKKRVLTPREIYSLRGITISQIYAGYFHSLAISTSGKLWGWGKNNDFILGVINQDEDDKKSSKKERTIYTPQELNVNKNLTRITGGDLNLQDDYFNKQNTIEITATISNITKIKTIACGGSHSLAITSGGEAFAWGYGSDVHYNYNLNNFIKGQLGIKDTKVLNKPMKIDFGDRQMVRIYAGYSHSMAISSRDEIFVWGDGSLGKLARQKPYSDVPISIEELSVKKIKKGACGYDNCAAITADKKLYTWGGNSNNKLGLTNCDNNYESTPRMVESLLGVRKVSLGFWHSAALTESNEIFTWGNGFMGQLGHEDLISKATPEKVYYNSLKYKDVKCGSYHTVAIDSKNQVYIWGKGGHNLNADPGKHKINPELIDDFKHIKGGVRKIKTGYGNTIVLTNDREVYGWGENTEGKVGIGSKNQIISTVGKVIFDYPEMKKNVKILKIFAGYNHCFAITDKDEIYGWGSSKSFRLTETYGNEQLYIPKNIVLFLSDKNQKGNNDSERIGAYVDQKAISSWLMSKNTNFNFNYIHKLIDSDDPKFLDENLMKRDVEFQKEMMDKIKKLNLLGFASDKYINYDMMLKLRIKDINNKTNDNNTQFDENRIFLYLDEIERIYTLFYVHPCLFKEYFEKEIDIPDFSQFMTGIKPLFTELKSYSRKCESMDNIIYLSFFKMLIRNDFLAAGKSIDQIFVKNSYSEQIIELYFYNRYGRNVLLTVFEKSYNDVYNICINKIQNEEINNKNDKGAINRVFTSIKTIFSKQAKSDGDYENFTKDNLNEIVNVMKIFLNDFEKNINKIPFYVFYCLTRIKKKLKKLIIDKAEILKDKNYLIMKEKIKFAVKRLFYKQLLPKLLDKAKNDFIIGLKSKKNRVVELFSNFINIISLLFEKASVNNLFKPSAEEIGDDTVIENFSYLNDNIKTFNLTLKEIFETTLITSKYDSKVESMSSTFYANMTPTVKKIKLNLKDIVDFLKIVNIAKDKLKSNPHTLDISHYSVFDLLFDKLGTLKSDILLDNSLTVNLYIDSRYMIEPARFFNRFKKELKLANKEIGNKKMTLDFLNRCKLCHLIVPNFCILNSENRDNQLYKPFKSKVKKEYFIYACEVFRDSQFNRGIEINSILELSNAIDSFLESHPACEDNATRLLGGLQEYNKEDGKEKLYEKFLIQLKKHIKIQHKHFEFIMKISKIINDINEAENIYYTKLDSINRDIDSAIGAIRVMENSLVFEDDSDEVMAGKSRLTHLKLKLRQFNQDAKNFKFNILDQPVRIMLRRSILLLLHNEKDKENDRNLNRIEVTSNADGVNYFQISLKGKSKETLSSFKLTYDEFVYRCINSNCFSVLFMENFATFNIVMFQKAMHELIFIDSKKNTTKK